MCDACADWRHNWQVFVKKVDEQLLRGQRFDEIEARFRNSPVTWSGIVVEKQLNQKRGSPCVIMQMEKCILRNSECHYPADTLILRFGNDTRRIAPWWHVPIGTVVEFEAIIAREVWSKCISIRCDSLVVDTKHNPVLKSPIEYASKVDVPEELELAIHPKPRIELSLAPPQVTVPRTTELTLEWERSRQGNTTLHSATLRSHAPVDVALVEFWERVLANGPNNSEWRVVEAVGLPENGLLSVGFLNSELHNAQPIRFVFNAGVLAEVLSGMPSDEATEAQAFDFFERFWTIVHAALCSAEGVADFSKAHPDVIVLAIDHDDTSHRQLELPN
jgi:hypothetical protein